MARVQKNALGMSGAYMNLRSQTTATGGQKSPDDSSVQKKRYHQNGCVQYHS